MAWFFAEVPVSGRITINGEDALHIQKSLRMAVGDELTVCTPDAIMHTCAIESVNPSSVTVKVLKSEECKNEPNLKVTLFQALPKGDKLDEIVKKSVEMGVYRIVPVLTERCVSRPDAKATEKKVDRLNKIAHSAAKQSRRGIIPEVSGVMNLRDAVGEASKCEQTVVFYECGGQSPGSLIKKGTQSLAVFIGPEGGFEESEIELIIKNGGTAATLGSRILRTETAPVAALSIIMYISGNM